jgi:hypothetical protein
MRLSVAVLVVAAFVACKKPEPPAKPAAQAGAPTAAAPASEVMRGKILEKLEAPPYSYLKLQTASGETWAAVPATQVAVGAEIGVANAFPMQDFESKTLNKKFQVVYFGTVAGDGQHGPGDGHDHGPGDGHDHGAPAGGQAAVPAGMGGMGGGAMGEKPDPAAMAAQHGMVAKGPTDVKIQKVEKAKGADGRTVAEVYAQKGALKEKNVTVRGQVVKFSAGIMGKNWVHVRDGSGTAEKSDHDLTITTMDSTQVGDVVTVKGTVKVDKDFGSGYQYPVIVEDAKVSK